MKINAVLILLLLLPVPLFCVSIHCPGAQNILFERLDVADGLSQNTVYAILQDKRGFMWFCTQDGLNKYDGLNFKVYTHDVTTRQSLSQASIRAAYKGRGGILWLAVIGGGLNKFDPEKETVSRYQYHRDNPKTISHNDLRAVIEDRDGEVWAGTLAGLNKLDPKTGYFTRFLHEPGNNETLIDNIVNGIIQDRNDRLWVAAGNALHLLEKETGTFRVFQVPTPVSGDCRIVSLYQGNDGRFWIGTEGSGLYRFNPEKGQFRACFYDESAKNEPGFNRIQAIVQDRDNGDLLWLGTYGGGIVIYNTKTKGFRRLLHSPGNPSSLSGNYIYSIYQSRSGIIWVGTRGGGISKYDRRKRWFSHFCRKKNGQGLSDNHIRAFARDVNGDILVGTWGGGLNRLNPEGKILRVYNNSGKNESNLADNYVRALCVTRKGTLWVGTEQNGLYKFDRASETFTPFPLDTKIPESFGHTFINRIVEDRDGMLWVATYDGLFRLNQEDGQTKVYLPNPNQPGSIGSDDVYTIHVDSMNVVWIGFYWRGFDRFNRQSETFTHYRYKGLGDRSGVSCDRIFSLYRDKKGILWIGTHSGGLNKLDTQTQMFTYYTTRDGLPNNNIYGILEDHRGYLWLSTNRGLARFDPEREIFKNYTLKDGLQGYEFNGHAYYKSPSGQLFFGGLNGFNCFFPDQLPENEYIPPVVLTGFSIAGNEVPISEGSFLEKHIGATAQLVLSYRENILSFRFAALDYAAPKENRFQYMLEGFNHRWLHLGTKNDITLTNLNPGSYTLRVRGSNNDGVWNHQGTSIRIIITPPFWRTWWFQTLLLLSSLGLAAAWHRNRMNNLTLRLKSEAQMERILARYKVSNREREIIQLMLKGKSNKDIEDELYISIKTVKSHVYNVYQKLGVKNRLELIHLIQKSSKGE